MQWKIIWGRVDKQLWVLAEAYYTLLYHVWKLVQKPRSGIISQVGLGLVHFNLRSGNGT